MCFVEIVKLNRRPMTINTHVRFCLIISMNVVCVGDVYTVILSPRRGILKFLVTRTFQPVSAHGILRWAAPSFIKVIVAIFI